MTSKLTSTTRQLGRYLVAATLVVALTLTCATAHAQMVTTPAPAEQTVSKNIDYYLDGQKVGQDALSKVSPNEISNVQILNRTQQQQIFGATAADGAAVFTTKANAGSPTIQALNKRISTVVFLIPAAVKRRI